MSVNNGIYIHIPFCKSKCSYCAFVSGNHPEDIKKMYFDSLVREIRERDVFFEEANTLYIGGGTPSFVEKEYIERIVFEIKDRYDATNISEFTIEMNPESVNADLIEFYKDIGANRFSVGVQSFDNRVLKLLNRPHRRREAERVLSLFSDNDNLSIDLIWGVNGFSQDISFIDDYPIKHLSCYLLTLEENSALFREKYKEKKDIFIEKEYYKILEEIYKRGFERYEVSNFACEGFESKHNLSYWNLDSQYIGYGVSAASYNLKKRMQNTDDISIYIKHIHESSQLEDVTDIRRGLERIMLCLRTRAGLYVDNNIKMHLKKERMIEFILDGSLEFNDNVLKCTDKGYLIMNYIIAEITV
ncbi:TPA: hypothetical protein DCW38_02705 [candidate division WOR-3 bacterium]|uniref:Heme chaperone HemW n=1 Tax=candidate division WOR-3 bacterium TaxID=2052148 RepID=A0A350H957_UNCW3|nr:hypothetical protein [candidate division WOR-3 bacterium]